MEQPVTLKLQVAYTADGSFEHFSLYASVVSQYIFDSSGSGIMTLMETVLQPTCCQGRSQLPAHATANRVMQSMQRFA